MAVRAHPRGDSQAPKPRIVQFRNRRYSVRLEPVFWRTLEFLAELRGQRLGQFIGELARDYQGRNFASHLRTLCMIETDRARAEASLRPTLINAVDLVGACPSPGLVLSRYRTILAYNQGFIDWLAADSPPAIGTDLTTVIQVRTRRPLNDLWLDLVAGKLMSAEANVLHVTPGRAVAASARLLAVPPAHGDDFYAVMWLASPRGPAASPERRPPAV